MPEVGRWNGHLFEVSGSLIRSFSEMSIKAGCETEDKTSSKQKYVSRKSGNAAEVSMKIYLLKAMGVDVRAETDSFIAEATAGKKDYFYVGGGKLLPCQLMLTQAEVHEIEIAPGGTWVSAEIQLTMKQADKGDGKSSGSSSGGGSSGNKKSVSSTGIIATSTGTEAAKKVGSKVAEKAASGGVVTNAIPGAGLISGNSGSGSSGTWSNAIQNLSSLSGVAQKTDAVKAMAEESARQKEIKEQSKLAERNTAAYYTSGSGKKIPILKK